MKGWSYLDSLALEHPAVPDPPRWPVHKHSSPDDVILGKKSPNVPIKTVISIVAKDEDVPWRNDNGPELVLGRLGGERFIRLDPVDVESPALYFHSVPFHCDDALDEGLPRPIRVTVPFHNVPKGLGRVEDHDLVSVERFDQFGHLLDRQLIADLERWVHRKAGNIAGLDDGESQQQGYE